MTSVVSSAVRATLLPRRLTGGAVVRGLEVALPLPTTALPLGVGAGDVVEPLQPASPKNPARNTSEARLITPSNETTLVSYSEKFSIRLSDDYPRARTRLRPAPMT